MVKPQLSNGCGVKADVCGSKCKEAGLKTPRRCASQADCDGLQFNREDKPFGKCALRMKKIIVINRTGL